MGKQGEKFKKYLLVPIKNLELFYDKICMFTFKPKFPKRLDLSIIFIDFRN